MDSSTNLLFNLQLMMLAGMYLFGGSSFALGVSILILDIFSKDVRQIISQTNRLAQKGLADEISGLVGNASTLLTTVNEMMRTRSGIGLALTIIGVLLMFLPYYLTLSL